MIFRCVNLIKAKINTGNTNSAIAKQLLYQINKYQHLRYEKLKETLLGIIFFPSSSILDGRDLSLSAKLSDRRTLDARPMKRKNN